MGYLGQLNGVGTLSPRVPNPVTPGGWVVEFDPATIGIRVDAEVYHMAVQGPPSSQFQVYLDTTFYDNVVRGDVNSWDPSQPMLVRPGTSIYLYYNTGAGNAPRATLFFREVSPL